VAAPAHRRGNATPESQIEGLVAKFAVDFNLAVVQGSGEFHARNSPVSRAL
jgi:hypothetical protein